MRQRVNQDLVVIELNRHGSRRERDRVCVDRARQRALEIEWNLDELRVDRWTGDHTGGVVWGSRWQLAVTGR